MTSAGHPTSVVLRDIAAVEAMLPADDGWLSSPEKIRLASLMNVTRRRQFIAGHWLARQCLASYAGGDWTGYQLSAPEMAAPRVIAAPSGADPAQLHISLSHSGDWLLCAVSNRPVGVDIERSNRPRDFAALNEWLHEPDALKTWTKRTAAGQQQWFYQQWTLKEAWLKWHHAAHADTASPRLQSRSFLTAAPDDGVAMTGHNEILTMAIYPATPELVQWDIGATSQLNFSSWQTPDPFR